VPVGEGGKCSESLPMWCPLNVHRNKPDLSIVFEILQAVAEVNIISVSQIKSLSHQPLIRESHEEKAALTDDPDRGFSRP